MLVLVLCLRVIDCDVSDSVDMPSLKSLEFGRQAFSDSSRSQFVFKSD